MAKRRQPTSSPWDCLHALQRRRRPRWTARRSCSWPRLSPLRPSTPRVSTASQRAFNSCLGRGAGGRRSLPWAWKSQHDAAMRTWRTSPCTHLGAALLAGKDADDGLTVAPKPVPAPTGKPAKEIVAEVNAKVSAVTRLVSKVGDSWAPWKATKNRVRSEQVRPPLCRGGARAISGAGCGRQALPRHLRCALPALPSPTRRLCRSWSACACWWACRPRRSRAWRWRTRSCRSSRPSPRRRRPPLASSGRGWPR